MRAPELTNSAFNWLRLSQPDSAAEVNVLPTVKSDVRLNPAEIKYRPHEKQELFHRAINKTRLYIGGNRSGKTVAGVVECLYYISGQHLYRSPIVPVEGSGAASPVLGRVIGVDFPAGIQKILLPVFKMMTPANWLYGGSWENAYAKQSKVLTFANGSQIDFMSADQSLDSFAGVYRHFIYIDEECPESIYLENKARLVDYNGDMWITATPIMGMTWLYSTIYLPGKGIADPLRENKPGEKVLSNEDGTVGVVEVSTKDNPYINQEALKSFIGSLKTENDYEIRIEGKFIQLTGLVYPNFGEENVMKFEEFEKFGFNKTNSSIVVSMDHGLRNPSAWLWHLVSENGSVITFWELYEREKTIEEMSRLVRDINSRFGLVPLYYIGDPAIRARSAITGTSVQEEYAKNGIGIVLGSNDVAAGIERVKSAIDNGWRVTHNCKNLLWEIHKYAWMNYSNARVGERKNEPDQPVKKDDHLCDALRYFFSNRPELLAKPGKKPETKAKIDEWVIRRRKNDIWKQQKNRMDDYLGMY